VDAFPQGTVHEAGEDLRAALRADPEVLALWSALTPLGRNEFICWVDDAKQQVTRQRRIRGRDCAIAILSSATTPIARSLSSQSCANRSQSVRSLFARS
jgi:hypothetical protein